MGIRKAQVFTIRSSGLGQPSISYGKPALSASSLLIDYCSFTFEGLIRAAIEQIKMYVHRNAWGKVKQKSPNRQAIRRLKSGMG